MHAVMPSCWGMFVYRDETSRVARMALVGMSVAMSMSRRLWVFLRYAGMCFSYGCK